MKFRKKFKPKTAKASPRSRRAIMVATFMTASLSNRNGEGRIKKSIGWNFGVTSLLCASAR